MVVFVIFYLKSIKFKNITSVLVLKARPFLILNLSLTNPYNQNIMFRKLSTIIVSST